MLFTQEQRTLSGRSSRRFIARDLLKIKKSRASSCLPGWLFTSVNNIAGRCGGYSFISQGEIQGALY